MCFMVIIILENKQHMQERTVRVKFNVGPLYLLKAVLFFKKRMNKRQKRGIGLK